MRGTRARGLSRSAALTVVALFCVSCKERALTDEELDVGLRNARVGLAASCIKGPGHAAAEVLVRVSLDVGEGGEVRYAKVTAPELPEGSRACMQEALMRLRFRPGGTGGARERTMLVNLKDELPPSLTW